MPLDVVCEVVIDQQRLVVGDFAVNPDNASDWHGGMTSVRMITARPLAVGSQIAVVGRFRGRRRRYVYEVREHVRSERFVMRTAQGAFPLETSYAFADTEDGGTLVTLRHRGEPRGLAALTAPVRTSAMRRDGARDLERLRDILEAPSR